MTYESEDKILAKKFKEEDIFPAKAPRIQYGIGKGLLHTQVPADVLDFYSISDQEKEWATRIAKQAMEGQRMVLGQLSDLRYKIYAENSGKANDYFDEKFSRFYEVIDKFQKSSPTSFVYRKVLGLSSVKLVYKPVSLIERKRVFLKQLGELFQKAIEDEIQTHKDNAYGSSPEDWKKSTQNRWQPLGPMPIVPPDGLSPKEAETHVSQILKFYGLEGVQKTRYSRDGGIDVESNTAVFQVKHQVAPVGVQVVREIYGVASAIGKRAGIFAKTGFTKEAKSFAEKNGIALFRYVPSVKGLTPLSKSLEETGFASFK